MGRFLAKGVSMGTSTPWGVADDSERIARGIMRYRTPGHGGDHLSARRQAEMPAALRLDDGWYEEDCDWARVALGLPQFFSDKAQQATAQRYRPQLVAG